MKIKVSRLRELIAEENEKLEEAEKIENNLKDFILKEVEDTFATQYEAEILLIYDAKLNVTDLLTQMRGLKGVTIVNVEIESHEVRAGQMRTVCKSKFLRGNVTLENYLNHLHKLIARIPGISQIKFMKVRRVEV